MRRIVRVELPQRVSQYLTKKQREVDSGGDVDAIWTSARQTRSMKAVYEHLVIMAGNRARCMYCQDSRGVNIEHFWPKSAFPQRTFQWDNLILACSGCDIRKGTRFPLDESGEPLLIDPTAEDPWDHLYFDARTGIVTARFLDDGRVDPRGEYTTRGSGLPLNIEPVTKGRSRTVRNLGRCIQQFIDSTARQDNPRLQQDLISCIDDADDYGMGTWFVHREGRADSPFAKLRDGHPATWTLLEERLSIMM